MVSTACFGLRYFELGNSCRTAAWRCLWNTRRADAGAASLRIERIANPDDHFGFGGKRQNFSMKDFGAAVGEGASFVVAELMQKVRLGGFAGVGGVDAVDVGPNDELVGVHNVSDDGAGKIGAVAAERGDAAVGSCADEAGDDGHNTGFEKRKKNVAATLPGLFEMGLGIAECVASQNEFRRSDGDRGNARLFESGCEEPDAETFAKGGETIEKFGASGDAAVNWNFVEKVASQELQLVAHAEAIVFGKLQIVKHIEVKIQDELGFMAGVGKFAAGERPRNGKEMVGDALHRGDNHGDIGRPRGGSNKARSMEHAVRAEKRTAAELESDDLRELPGYPA